jgi:rubrerythrin
LSTTKYNLWFAFAGESQMNRKYLFLVEKAEDDDQAHILRLFHAAADAETLHARNHMTIMQGTKSTRKTLLTTIGIENQAFTNMYPAFIRQAEIEGDKKAAYSYDMANRVE